MEKPISIDLISTQKPEELPPYTKFPGFFPELVLIFLLLFP
jgi:hypothetical protein